jgi:aspartate kinase
VKDRIDSFIRDIQDEFRCKVEDGLELITVRHYNEDTIANLKKGKVVLFEERIRNTLQMAVKNVPLVERREVELERAKG